MTERRQSTWTRLKRALAEQDEAAVLARDVRTLAMRIEPELDPYEDEVLAALLGRQAIAAAAEHIVDAIFAHDRPIDAESAALVASVMRRVRPTFDPRLLDALGSGPAEPSSYDAWLTEYEAMREAGADLASIVGAAHARGLSRLLCVKLARALFGLGFVRAIRAVDEVLGEQA